MATELRVAFIALLALLLGAAAASAHAVLDRASPAVGSTLRSAPREVSLRFTGNLEAAFSTVVVSNSAGARVDVGNVHVDSANRRLLRVSLSPLPPGVYRVVWRVVSVDSHTTEGEYAFRVDE